MIHLFDDANGRQLKAIAGMTQLPEYVADYQSDKSASTISPDECADESGAAYPVHDAASTWMSNAYFRLRKAAGLFVEYHRGHATLVDSNIKRAGAAYGISADLAKADADITAAVEAQREAKLADSDYGLCKRAADGSVSERSFPMIDANGVKMASAAYERKRATLPSDDRAAVAEAIVAKAAYYGVPAADIPDTIWDDAGKSVATKDMFKAAVAERMRVCPEGASALSGVYAAIDACTPAGLVECKRAFRAALDAFDGAFGTAGRVAPFVGIPFHKAASVVAEEVSINGKRMKLAVLREVPRDVFQAALGAAADELPDVAAFGDQETANKFASALRRLTHEQQLCLDTELRAALGGGVEMGGTSASKSAELACASAVEELVKVGATVGKSTALFGDDLLRELAGMGKGG